MSERRRAVDELQTNAFIASDEIVSAILTSEYDITLQKNAFCAEDEQILLALDTNAFRTGYERASRWRCRTVAGGVRWVRTNPPYGRTNVYCSTNVDVAKLVGTVAMFTLIHVGTVTIFTILTWWALSPRDSKCSTHEY